MDIKETTVDSLETGKTKTSLFNTIDIGAYLHISIGVMTASAVKTEIARRNNIARYKGEIRSGMDLKFKVSVTYKDGYTSVLRLK